MEIGTGSAYQASVLAELGVQVYTIERQKKLFESNKQFDFIKKISNIKFFYGDGYEGLPTFAPFDKVLITAAAPDIPQKLVQQMKQGAMMVIPVGTGEVQVMKRLTKQKDGGLKEEIFDRLVLFPCWEARTINDIEGKEYTIVSFPLLSFLFINHSIIRCVVNNQAQ